MNNKNENKCLSEFDHKINACPAEDYKFELKNPQEVLMTLEKIKFLEVEEGFFDVTVTNFCKKTFKPFSCKGFPNSRLFFFARTTDNFICNVYLEDKIMLTLELQIDCDNKDCVRHKKLHDDKFLIKVLNKGDLNVLKDAIIERKETK